MRICLYGGPGVGKTALSSWLFSQLKMNCPEMHIEQVHEFIKAWAWENRVPKSWDQFFIFGNQLHHEDKVLRHGVHIVTDSPLLLQIAYLQRQKNPFADECLSLCRKFEMEYPAIHINLIRSVPYNPKGRYETLDQAIEMDKRISDLLIGINHVVFDPLNKNNILDYVLENMK